MTPAGRGRDRRHLVPGRRRQLGVRCTEEEYAVLVEAARRAGLTPTGYVAEAALAAARDAVPLHPEPWREVLAELVAARSQVRRFGVNVNQAVRVLNSTGEPPEALAGTIAATDRVVARLDRLAAELARRVTASPGGRG